MTNVRRKIKDICDLDRNYRIKIPLLFICLYASVLVIIFMLLGDRYVFGSYIDWNTQHAVLPDYFRQKFYETGSLTGDLALELGSGISAYSLAYHGMLNPVILPSYLFPGLHMFHYVMISSVILMFLGAFLTYVWIHGNGFSRGISFFASCVFAFASPVIYHFHKHLMYIDYIPFIILCYIGIDRMIKKGKPLLFILSLALSLMTSFYFSIAIIIAVTLYFFYRRIETNGFKNGFIKDSAHFMLSGISGCLLTAVLLLPSIYAIISEREQNAHGKSFGILSFLIPGNVFAKTTHWANGAGLGLIFLFSLFALFFFRKPHTRLLSISVTLLTVIPAFSYMMNGFLYDHEKAFISMLPLFILIICIFIKDGKELNIPIPALIVFAAGILIYAKIVKARYFYYLLAEAIILTVLVILFLKKKYVKPICVYAVLFSVIFSIIINYGQTGQYMLIYRYENLMNKARAELIEGVSDRDGVTRVGDLTDLWYSCNLTYGSDVSRSSVYSSSSNDRYLHLLHDLLALTNPSPHKIVVSDVNDLFYSTLLGQRYMLGYEDTKVYNYYAEAEKDGWYLYENQKAYTVGFAAENKMSIREFDKLDPAERRLALLKYAVVNENIGDVFVSPFEEIDISSQIPLDNDENGYHIVTDGSAEFTLEPERIHDNAILALNVHIDKMQLRNIEVGANGIKNVFAGYESAFPNDNSDMWFILSDNCDSIDLSFSHGDYTVNHIKLYSMDAEELDTCYGSVTMAKEIKYNGRDTVSAKIDMKDQGTFLFTVPYTEGYTLYVDNRETPIQIIDEAFIGCELPEGEHELTLKFEPPLKSAGALLSVIGIVMTVGIAVYGKIKKKKSGV